MTTRELFQLDKNIGYHHIVFIGNYTDEQYNYGIECLIYLFALKLCSPNKVHLLRGAHELDGNTASALKNLCAVKYGDDHGKMLFAILMQVFARLPIAVVVDDSVLCTHSGIPSTRATTRIGPALLKLPKEMSSLKRDSPMAYEMITRCPQDLGTVSPETEPVAITDHNYPQGVIVGIDGKTSHAGAVVGLNNNPQKNINCKLDSAKKAKTAPVKSCSAKPKSVKTTKKHQPMTWKSAPVSPQKSTKSVSEF